MADSDHRPSPNQQEQPMKHQKQDSTEEQVYHPRPLCFLEKDNSFLSPWSWDSKASNTTITLPSTQQINHYQQGSFFTLQVCFYFHIFYLNT